MQVSDCYESGVSAVEDVALVNDVENNQDIPVARYTGKCLSQLEPDEANYTHGMTQLAIPVNYVRSKDSEALGSPLGMYKPIPAEEFSSVFQAHQLKGDDSWLFGHLVQPGDDVTTHPNGLTQKAKLLALFLTTRLRTDAS